MLVIRKEQMDAFQKQAEDNFIIYVIQKLKKKYSDCVKDSSPDTLYKRVEYGIKKAREYGLTWKNNLIVFVALMFQIGPKFHEFPAFNKYLTKEDVQPNDRMSNLLKKTSQTDWREARNVILKDDWNDNK